MRAHSVPDGSPRSRRKARPWGRAVLTAGVLLAALGSAACEPDRELARDVGVELSFDPAPHVGDTTCSIRLTGPAGAPVAGAAVAIEGNMNHAGMVPVFGEATEAEPGLYRAPLEFTMGGDWFVIVRADLADGRALEEILDVPGVPVTGSEGDVPSCCQTASQ